MSTAVVKTNAHGRAVDCYDAEGHYIGAVSTNQTPTNAYISGDKIIVNTSDGKTEVYDRESLNYLYTI